MTIMGWAGGGKILPTTIILKRYGLILVRIYVILSGKVIRSNVCGGVCGCNFFVGSGPHPWIISSLLGKVFHSETEMETEGKIPQHWNSRWLVHGPPMWSGGWRLDLTHGCAHT